MSLTYTVSPVHNYYRESVAGMPTLSRNVVGYRAVIRRGDYVVHMLPVFQLEATAHRVAQFHIKKLATPVKADLSYQKGIEFVNDPVNLR